MRHPGSPSPRLLTSALAAALLAGTGAAHARSDNIPPSADASAIYRRDTGIDRSGDHRREVQACREGRTQQSLDTCLEEARNAHAARRRGELVRQGEDYTANALARCSPLSGEYRVACEARVMGFGSATGGVAGGGLLRQVETVVIPPGAQRVRIDTRTADALLLVPPPRR